MTQIFDGLPGLWVYIDDILVWGATPEEHDYKTLARVEAEGLTLNAENCICGQEEISFLGNRVSSKGMEPNPDLVKCVKQHPIPTSKKEV